MAAGTYSHAVPARRRKLKVVEIARKCRGVCESFRSTRRSNATFCGGGLMEVHMILLRSSAKSAEIDPNFGPQVVLCAQNWCCVLVLATLLSSAHAPLSLGPLETLDRGSVLGARPTRCDMANCQTRRTCLRKQGLVGNGTGCTPSKRHVPKRHAAGDRYNSLVMPSKPVMSKMTFFISPPDRTEMRRACTATLADVLCLTSESARDVWVVDLRTRRYGVSRPARRPAPVRTCTGVCSVPNMDVFTRMVVSRTGCGHRVDTPEHPTDSTSTLR